MELIDTLRGALQTLPDDILAVWLYGSRARGDARAESDVDLAILRGRLSRGTFDDLPLDLESELEHAVQRPVSVIAVDDAPPDLVHRVLRDGVLLVDRDPAVRIRFEVRSRNEYFDLLPILEAYRAAGR